MKKTIYGMLFSILIVAAVSLALPTTDPGFDAGDLVCLAMDQEQPVGQATVNAAEGIADVDPVEGKEAMVLKAPEFDPDDSSGTAYVSVFKQRTDDVPTPPGTGKRRC